MQGERNPPIVQRYATGLWPHIRGEVPFVVRGPNWNGRHTVRRVLDAHEFTALDHTEIRLVVAEFILREGLCQAAWSVELDTCQPPERRWNVAVQQVASEIPSISDTWPISLGVWELLDGMSRIEHYQRYLWQDEVVLEVMSIPSDRLAT